MTGHQDHAATGKTLKGEPTYTVILPCVSRLVLTMYMINAFDTARLEKVVKEATAIDDVGNYYEISLFC